jgi:hypothetical protein
MSYACRIYLCIKLAERLQYVGSDPASWAVIECDWRYFVVSKRYQLVPVLANSD